MRQGAGQVVKIIQHSDTDISVSLLHQPGFDISSEDSEAHFGAIHMCVASLAWCTFSVLASYGQRIETPATDMTIRLQWNYAQRPYRIEKIKMAIHWPQVPESRLDAAMRAAALCTLHNTMMHGLEIDTSIER